MKKVFMVVLVAAVFFTVANVYADIQTLSIFDIQYVDVNEHPDGNSPEEGKIVNCTGGIVIHKSSPPIRPKLTLYDPNYPDGWGGIMVKDPCSVGAFTKVNVGDWYSFTNVEVEEFRGTTLLQYKSKNDPNLQKVSSDNTLPEPLVVGVDEIAAPIEGVGEWVVENHNSEKYEGMLVKVIDVNVWDTGYGKEPDNYILQSNVDPNLTCWASDYMNEDIDEIYHPYVEIGQKFCGVAGVIEQYTGEKDGIYYDYYQLLTTTTADFTIEQNCDLNDDCGVDFVDFTLFAYYWLTEEQCTEPDWCGGADFADSRNGSVDANDLKVFTDNWLTGTK